MHLFIEVALNPTTGENDGEIYDDVADISLEVK